MKKLLILTTFVFIITFGDAKSEPIFHEKFYPPGDGPFPTVLLLHTSGGYKTVGKNVKYYVSRGYAVYTPDYYKRYGIKKRTRQSGFYEDRENIDKDLLELISFIKKDSRVDAKNLFAVGYSAGNFPAVFLTSSNLVSAGSGHFVVWKPNFGRRSDDSDEYPAKYFTKSSSPFLAIHAEDDDTQRYSSASLAWQIIRKGGFNIETETFKTGGHPFKDNEIVERSVDITDKFFRKHIKR